MSVNTWSDQMENNHKKNKIINMKNPVLLSIKECFIVTLNSIKEFYCNDKCYKTYCLNIIW